MAPQRQENGKSGNKSLAKLEASSLCKARTFGSLFCTLGNLVWVCGQGRLLLSIGLGHFPVQSLATAGREVG